MDPLDLENLEIGLQEKYGKFTISKYDVLSAALYPKVKINIFKIIGI